MTDDKLPATSPVPARPGPACDPARGTEDLDQLFDTLTRALDDTPIPPHLHDLARRLERALAERLEGTPGGGGTIG